MGSEIVGGQKKTTQYCGDWSLSHDHNPNDPLMPGSRFFLLRAKCPASTYFAI